MDSDASAAVVGAGAALLGAFVGGWVTWEATKRAARESARQMAMERLDLAVQELAQQAGPMARSMDNKSSADMRSVVDAGGIVVVRARWLSPRLSFMTAELMMRADAMMSGPDPEPLKLAPGVHMMSTAWWRAVAVELWALNDVTLQWLESPEHFEAGAESVDDVVEDARAARYSAEA